MTLRRVTLTDPRKEDYYYEEAIKTLRTNIQFTGMDVKVIVLTSCYPNEGKSDITFQLGREIAKMGKRILILDADIRKSSFLTRYGIDGEIKGLSQYLSGQAGGREILYETNYPNLSIVFAGPAAPNPSELLEQAAFARLLEIFKGHYDYILIDTPPIASVVDAAIIARHCDGAVLVVESNLVSRKAAARAKIQLERSGCRVLGGVLNKVDLKKDRYYSKYSYYYRREEEPERKAEDEAQL